MHLSHICGVPPEKVNVHYRIAASSFHFNKLFVYSVLEFIVNSVNEFQKNNFFIFINLFHAIGLFQYPLKKENLWFSNVFREYRKRPAAWNGLIVS